MRLIFRPERARPGAQFQQLQRRVRPCAEGSQQLVEDPLRPGRFVGAEALVQRYARVEVAVALILPADKLRIVDRVHGCPLGVLPALDQEIALLDAVRVVELEDEYGDTPVRGERADLGAVQLEMIAPTLGARVIERH